MGVRMTTAQWLTKAKKARATEYDYSLVDYQGCYEDIIIICKIHGSFSQMASEHLKGRKCPECADFAMKNAMRSDKETFIKESNEIYGEDVYDYSLVNYINNYTSVDIICKIHGKFSQTPGHHKSSVFGCRKCSDEAKRSNTQEFIEKSIKIYGDDYDYSLVNYESDEKVKIICKFHNKIFLKTPNKHLMGQGCPKCSKMYSIKETAWLDSLNIPVNFRDQKLNFNGRIIKPDAVDLENKIIWEFYGDVWHANPEVYHLDDIHKINKSKINRQVYEATMEKEEFLRNAGYTLITIWENKWDMITDNATYWYL